jgi:phosphohistidine swiveling domain-containing protein
MNKISHLSQIKSEKWVKNWSGNWRIAFATLYYTYTQGLKSYIGKNLDTNLLVCEQKVSSNYIAKKVLDKYCTYTAGLIIKDNALAKKWAKDTIATAEHLFEVMAKLKNKNNLTLSNLLELKSAFYLHIPPHFSMKKVVDYLPEKLQKKLTPGLIAARLKTEHLFNAVDLALRKYTKLIAQETGHAKDLVDFLTIDEIEQYLKNHKLPSKKELVGRSNGVAFFCQQKTVELLVGSSYKDLQKGLASFTGNELKGSIAYRGLAKGTARIIFNPFKVKKFDKGDVLITGMTRPEFLPLMKKASAFVTDAGGLLSHAAIVARELKKPCILATENASKVIKDGDLVEVDANNGIVRILKRAS